MAKKKSNYKYRATLIYTTGRDIALNKKTVKYVFGQFKTLKELQVIIIDNSGKQEIEQEYSVLKEKYVDSLTIIKMHAALSKAEAYNIGLEYAEGEWITCVDAGDEFDRDYCAHCINFLSKRYVKAKVAVTARYVDNSISRSRDEYSLITLGTDTILDLDINPKWLPISMNGVFVHSEVIKGYQFDTTLEYDFEKQFFYSLLLKSRKLAAIGKKTYFCQEPLENNYRVFGGVYDRKWYFDTVDDFMVPFLKKAKEEHGSIPMIIQYSALGYIMCRLEANMDNRNRHVLSKEEAYDYQGYIRRILEFIEDKHILNMHEVGFYTKTPNNMKLLLQIKYNDFDLKFNYFFKRKELNVAFNNVSFYSVNSLRMNILFMEYVDGMLEIDASFPDYFDLRDVEVFATINDKKYNFRYEENYSLTKFFGCSAYKRYTFHLSLPLKEKYERQAIQFKMVYEGEIYVIAPEYQSHTSRLSGSLKSSYWKFDQFMAYYDSNSIVIRKASNKKVIIQELRIAKELLQKKTKIHLKILAARTLYWIYRPFYKNKRIWMFYDKIYKGGDSAEYIYRYSKQFEDNISKYYLLDKNCPDYKRLKKDGYIPLRRGSLKHRMVFFNADMVIVSNSTVFAFNDYSMGISAFFRGIFDFHVACVQHGMSVQKIAVAQKRLRDNTRLYFCASKYEIENLSKPIYNYVGYDALKLTGVPRYDGLIDESDKQIMISPTWRMQSARLVSTNEGVERDYNPLFKESEYYKVYNSLINDPRLIDAAREYGYRIKYVLHPIVSPQAGDFDKNDYVDIVPSTSDMSYEEMFRKSSLMVTDYSGIQFDFAYMRKPLVYLHHDDIPQHYEEGTYHYDSMAFGEICHNNDELIMMLIDYMKGGCVMKEEFRRRADDFFEFNDHNNCERIYNEMIKYQAKIDRIKNR